MMTMPDENEIKKFRNPFPTTDIIIEFNDGNKEGIILIDRVNPPYGKALPGGFAEWGISLEDNARKEAKEETNLDIILLNPEHPLCVKSNPARDPRGHMISVAYVAKGSGTLKAGDDAKLAGIYSLDEVIKLIDDRKIVFDHADIIKDYMGFRGYTPKNLGTVGCVGRFKPLHNGGAAMLETLCEKSEHVIIGIGSSNKYNSRNPFTPTESREMIDAYLKDKFSNYEFKEVPDFAHIPEYSDGKKWKEYITDNFGILDHFISGNEYVSDLMRNTYDIIHPASIIPSEKHIYLRATEVRVEMARNGNWQDLVPKEVSEYITRNNLDKRFKKEFGLEILSQLADGLEYRGHESSYLEAMHTREA